MAILKLGGIVTEMSGKLGGQSIANHGTFATIKNITQRNKVPTLKQSRQRFLTSVITNSWSKLTQVQRDTFNATAPNYIYENRTGVEIARTGFGTYNFINQNLSLIDQPFLESAPLYVPVTEPKINIIDISTGVFKIQSNNSSSVYLFALFGVANLSFGITATPSNMKFLGYITSAQLLAGYDVVPDLVNVYGPLTFPNKMAITVDPINQTTGNRKQFVEVIQNIDTPMILEVTVPDGQSVTLPFVTGGTYLGEIDWGDGTVTTFNAFNSAGVTHTYVLGNVYKIQIFGAFPKFLVSNGAFKSFLSNIKQFGSNSFTALNFHGCLLLTVVTPIDTPILGSAAVTSLFSDCQNMQSISNLGNWDMSLSTSLTQAFFQCYLFKGTGLGNWKLNSATNLTNFARDCFVLNDDFSEWILPEVTALTTAFNRCRLLTSDFTKLRPNKCTVFSSMFEGCLVFNGNVDNWTFKNTGSFSFTFVFRGCPLFNRDVSAYNMQGCTSIAGTFDSCTIFNQNINSWNVASVTNFSSVFFHAKAYNQSTASWDIRNATNMTSYAQDSALNATNWNAMLIAWNALINPPLNIIITVKAIATGAGITAKNSLIANWGWTITEGA